MGDVRRIKLIGGHVAIDFVNTLGGLPDDPDDEFLHDYDDVVAWTELVQLLPTATADRLRRAAAARPPAARDALTRVHHLRGSLDDVLRARLEPSSRPPRAAVDDVQAAYLDAVAPAALTPDGAHLHWTWRDDSDDLHRPLWPVAVAAVDLLQRAPLTLLARCQHCRWLFLDTSRQRTRRWCSMSSCGAIVKMRRYRSGRNDRGAADAAAQPSR